MSASSSSTSSVEGSSESSSRNMLLQRYFQNVGTPSGIMSIVELGSASVSEEVKALMKMGLVLLVQQAETQVRVVPSLFTDGIVSFLHFFQV